MLALLFITCYGARAQKADYKFSAQIDSVFVRDTLPYRYQLAATDYSFIDEYLMALITRDKEFNGHTSSQPSQDKCSLMARYRPAPANDYIIQQAAKTSIVIINEAHHQPMHRVFATSLLPALKKLGYTYLGIETLDAKDSDLNYRGYPLVSSGYYSKEPCFGNFIRTALALGFTVFPYEASAEAQKRGENRDAVEAANIMQVWNKHPKGKYLIYCGYDHAIEDSTHNFMVLPMAGRVKLATGIDPFTIDQVQLTESSTRDYGNNYRKLINVDYDAVMLDSNGNAFYKAKSNLTTFDCNVYHPNTTYLHGRPTWRYTADKRYVPVTDVHIAYPVMVKAYLAKDDTEHAVPVDIIELQNAPDEKQLILDKKKKHVLVLTNAKGERQVVKVK